MRTRVLLVAVLAAAPLFALAAPASANCGYNVVTGEEVCGAPCWPLEGYVADPVGFVCTH